MVLIKKTNDDNDTDDDDDNDKNHLVVVVLIEARACDSPYGAHHRTLYHYQSGR